MSEIAVKEVRLNSKRILKILSDQSFFLGKERPLGIFSFKQFL